MTHAWDFDVAIVGGGPGGSSAAATLARRGHHVLVLERAEFPRFHIGESQLPWIDEPLTAIGAAHVIDSAGFVPKWGATFTTADGDRDRYADFTCAVEVPKPQTWQVPRDRFDRLLLEHAAACGARIEQGCRAEHADFDATGVTLSYADATGARHATRVQAVVDASGRSGFLSKQFGRRVADPVLRNIALHRQYEGVVRDDGRRAGDIRIVTREDGGWFWFIPTSDVVTSVGVVLPRTAYHRAARATATETLEALVEATPAARALLCDATPLSAARYEADYSYLHSLQAGPRFVLVGDAGAFLDPIFSTGVLLALQSGHEAGGAVADALAARDLGAHRFRAFERRVRKRYHHFRRFAVGFYDPAFRDLFMSPSSRFGLFEAVLSVLGGNWRPSLATRLRIRLFFLLVALQRVLPLAPRLTRPKVIGDVQ